MTTVALGGSVCAGRKMEGASTSSKGKTQSPCATAITLLTMRPRVCP